MQSRVPHFPVRSRHHWYCFPLVVALVLRPRPSPPLSLFRRPIPCPKTTGKSPPHTSAAVTSHQQRTPPIAADLQLVVVSIDKAAAT